MQPASARTCKVLGMPGVARQDLLSTERVQPGWFAELRRAWHIDSEEFPDKDMIRIVSGS
jgi:hypothetical protein